MTTPVDLDPENWEAFRATAHRALDDMIEHMRGLRERPVWREAPEEARERFRRELPVKGRDLAETLEDFDKYIKPYATGNAHPLFMGWVQGAGTPVGMVAEMLAAGLNVNCGGRNHIAIDVERQIALWMAQAFGFPPDASGIFVTGASMANFLSLLVAREHALGDKDVRLNGLSAIDGQLVAYASREAHNCVRQAMELAGLGSRHLRLIPFRRAPRHAHRRFAARHRRRPQGGPDAFSRRRHGGLGGHGRHRQSRPSRRRGPQRRHVVPYRRGLWRARRLVAGSKTLGQGAGARRQRRFRFSQMAACSL